MINSAKQVVVNAFRQDPRVSAPGRETIPQSEIGTRLSDDRFDMGDEAMSADADKDGNFLYPPERKQFDQVQAYTTSHKTLDMLEEYAGHPIKWAFEGQHLTVAPHAGEGVNAYYVRWQEAVCFYYFDSPQLEKTVQTAQSTDVVAHETGHALLDGLKPEYGSTFDNETKAFHEAFGDCTAMLYAASKKENCQDALAEGGGELSGDNCISRIAEEFGTAVRKLDQDPDRPYLRNERNDFRYAPPETLPSDAPREQLSREAHSFCQVFAGAFYRSMVNLHQEIKSGDRVQDLQDAARVLGQIFTLGVEMASPARARYKDVALAMLAAEGALFQGSHRQALEKAFLDTAILKSEDLSPETLPALKLPSELQGPEQSQGFLKEHAGELGVKADSWTPERITRDSRGNCVLEYLAHEPVTLRDGVAEVYGGLSLGFDSGGKLVHKSFDQVTPQAVVSELSGIAETHQRGQFSGSSRLPAQARVVATPQGPRIERLPVFID